VIGTEREREGGRERGRGGRVFLTCRLPGVVPWALAQGTKHTWQGDYLMAHMRTQSIHAHTHTRTCHTMLSVCSAFVRSHI